MNTLPLGYLRDLLIQDCAQCLDLFNDATDYSDKYLIEFGLGEQIARQNAILFLLAQIGEHLKYLNFI